MIRLLSPPSTCTSSDGGRCSLVPPARGSRPSFSYHGRRGGPCRRRLAPEVSGSVDWSDPRRSPNGMSREDDMDQTQVETARPQTTAPHGQCSEDQLPLHPVAKAQSWTAASLSRVTETFTPFLPPPPLTDSIGPTGAVPGGPARPSRASSTFGSRERGTPLL